MFENEIVRQQVYLQNLLTENETMLRKEHAELYQTANKLLKESAENLADLRAAGWNTDPISDTNGVVPEDKIKLAREKSRYYYHFSALIKASVRAFELLVHAKGHETTLQGENSQRFLTTFQRINQHIFGMRGQMDLLRRLMNDAEIYFQLITTDGSTYIRVVEPEDIVEKYNDPDDKNSVWAYKRKLPMRKGDKQQRYEWVFDIRFGTLNSQPGRNRIRSDIRDNYNTDAGAQVDFRNNPIYHFQINDGVPIATSALNWAKCYESALDMMLTVYAAISAISMIIKGKADHVTAVQNELANIANRGGANALVGSDLSVQQLNAGQSLIPTSNLEPFVQLVAMTYTLPIHIYGKDEPSGLGSDKNRNEMTRLAIEAWQQLFIEMETTLVEFAMLRGIDQTDASIGETLQMSNRLFQQMIDYGDDALTITYPELRPDDIETQLQALNLATYSQGQTNELITPRMYAERVFSLLKLPDSDKYLAELPEDWSEVGTATERSATEAPQISTDDDLDGLEEGMARGAIQDLDERITEMLAGSPSPQFADVLGHNDAIAEQWQTVALDLNLNRNTTQAVTEYLQQFGTTMTLPDFVTALAQNKVKVRGFGTTSRKQLEAKVTGDMRWYEAYNRKTSRRMRSPKWTRQSLWRTSK